MTSEVMFAPKKCKIGHDKISGTCRSQDFRVLFFHQRISRPCFGQYFPHCIQDLILPFLCLQLFFEAIHFFFGNINQNSKDISDIGRTNLRQDSWPQKLSTNSKYRWVYEHNGSKVTQYLSFM